MSAKRGRTLQLDDDIEFQRISWRLASATWMVLLALMALTLLGVFGDGLIGRAEAGDCDDPLRVEYPRLLRYGASARLRIQARAAADGTAVVGLDRMLHEAFRVSHVTPAPESTTITADGVQYRFRATPGVQAEILFELQPARHWLVRGAISSSESRLSLRQFIFP